MSIAARGDDESAKVNLMHNCIVVIYMQQADRFLSTSFNYSVNFRKFRGILAIPLHYCQSVTFVGHFAREVNKL